MGWADRYVAKLAAGEAVTFRPRGYSMRGRVNDRDECTVSPLARPPVEGDVVLCRVNDNQYLHLVKAIRVRGTKTEYLIGNNVGHDNGWVGANSIYGILTRCNGRDV